MLKARIIGGGLAGSEAAYQLLKRGWHVDMYEMRKGGKHTPCHHTDLLAELVCSNSLKSKLQDTASGTLKAELQLLDSMLLRAADNCAVPAGGALAVNRLDFSRAIEAEINKFDKFTLHGEEIAVIDDSIPTIIATGPLTSDALSTDIRRLTGDNLSFYDAAAPIIAADSIDINKAFFATRYNKGTDTDYLNCGMNRQEYKTFYDALINAKRAELHEFDTPQFFESCMPIEVMAMRGVDTIRYGMMKPRGIVNSVTGERYYAVVQLRRENVEGSAYNLVGFQTNLTFAEQKRVFGLIPGLANAEYHRYGVMHRNTFINSPQLLDNTYRLANSDSLYFAGQITGVEGYVESIMSGLIAAINLDRSIKGGEPFVAPTTTITGALSRYIAAPNDNYQPMNANFGILKALQSVPRDKKERKLAYSQRAIEDMKNYIVDMN